MLALLSSNEQKNEMVSTFNISKNPTMAGNNIICSILYFLNTFKGCLFTKEVLVIIPNFIGIVIERRDNGVPQQQYSTSVYGKFYLHHLLIVNIEVF